MRRLLPLFLILLISCSTLHRGRRNDLEMARYFRKKGDRVRAAVFYIRVLRKNQSNVEALEYLYHFYREENDRLRAFEVLMKLSSLQPGKPLWHLEMAEMLIGDGDLEDGCYELSRVKVADGLRKKYEKLKEECER